MNKQLGNKETESKPELYTVLPTVNFCNVGELRKALEDLPDDRFIACQVVAKDGKAWNMWGEFCPQVPQGTIACLTFKHDELDTLP